MLGLMSSAHRFAESLPNGFDSFPECRCKGSLIQNLTVAHPLSSKALAAIPDAVRQYFEVPALVSSWYPESHLGGVMYVLHEFVYQGDDDAFTRSFFHASKRLFSKPFYKVLLLVGSPQRLVRGLARSYQLFHRGASMRVVSSTNDHARIELEVPEALYPSIVRSATAQALLVAVELSGGRSAQVEHDRVASDRILFELRWT